MTTLHSTTHPLQSHPQKVGHPHTNPQGFIHQYDGLLAQAKPFQQARTGEYTLSRNPLNGDIVLGMKNVMGFYGIAFKPDGSVVVNRAPANGGPKQVLPAGSFDVAALQTLLQQKATADTERRPATLVAQTHPSLNALNATTAGSKFNLVA